MTALLALKQQYKQLTGKDFVAAGVPAPPAPKKKEAPSASAAPVAVDKKGPAKEAKSAAPKASTVVAEDALDLTTLTLFCGDGADEDLLRCVLVAQALKKDMKVARTAPASVAGRIPYYPALAVPSIASSSGHTCKLGTVIFGASAVCRYLALDSAGSEGSAFDEACLDLLDDTFSAQTKGSNGKTAICCLPVKVFQFGPVRGEMIIMLILPFHDGLLNTMRRSTRPFAPLAAVTRTRISAAQYPL